MPRTLFASRAPLFALLLSLLAPATALAQGEVSEAAPQNPPPIEPAPARPAPPPIMVVVLTSGRVSDEIVTAVQSALVAQIEPMAGGRPVLPLVAPQSRDAIAACQDDACIGGQLAQAGVQAGVIARLRGRGRRPIETALEIRDPVSGAQRREPVTGEVPTDAAAIPTALSALSAQLQGAMPSPPPPPATLLVTVNVDGARVQVDGQEIGISPLAPVDVTEGRHEIVVLAPGYLSMRRTTSIGPGEQARLDVTLQPIGAQVVSEGSGAPVPVESDGGGDDLLGQWWFWTAVGGGAAVLIGIAIGIGVAVAGSSSQPMQDPTGIMLPPIMGGM